jgi:hypothetical protein
MVCQPEALYHSYALVTPHLQGVLLVLGQEDTSWNNMKKFLGAKAVKDEIVNYDARKITHEIRSKVGSAGCHWGWKSDCLCVNGWCCLQYYLPHCLQQQQSVTGTRAPVG